MKTSFELVAEFRDVEGKGASRRLRRENKVPAILYVAIVSRARWRSITPGCSSCWTMSGSTRRSST